MGELQLKPGVAADTREVNPEAYRLLLEGRHFWNQRGDENVERAALAFERALTLDPNFAELIALLRDLGLSGEASAHVERILPGMPAPSALRGLVLLADQRLDEALPNFEKTPVAMQGWMLFAFAHGPWRDDPRVLELVEKLGVTKRYQDIRSSRSRF